MAKNTIKKLLDKFPRLRTIVKKTNLESFQKTRSNSQALPFALYFDNREIFEKDLNSTEKGVIKELGIGSQIPKFLKDKLKKSGIYSYGIASTEVTDSEGEKIVIPDNLINDLIKAPYNKIFLSHENTDIASGTIEFAGRVPELDNQFIIAERLNEHHPMFKNFAGSIANKNLDAYTVAGSSDPVVNDGVNRIRKVNALREVSRTSYPANPEALINGLFFQKTKSGGYAHSQEAENMSEEDVKAIQESMETFGKQLSEGLEKIDGIATRVDSIEKFQKDLKDEASKDDDSKDAEADKADADKDDSDKDDSDKNSDDSKETTDEKVEKMVKEKVEKLEKSMTETFEKKLKELVPAKGQVKDNQEKFKKKLDSTMTDFLFDPSRTSLITPGGVK